MTKVSNKIEAPMYYIDCTNTLCFGHNTGIERVVRNIVKRIPESNQKFGVSFVPVIAIMGRFYCLNPKFSGKLRFTRLLYSTFGFFRDVVDKKYSIKKGTFIPDEIVAENRDDLGTHARIVRFCRKIMQIFLFITYLLDELIIHNKVLFNSNDVLFVPDALWNKHLIAALQNTHAQCLKKILLVHDIISLTHEGVAEDLGVKDFEQCLKYFIDSFDGIICVSQSTLREVVKYSQAIRSDVLFDYFYLGADFTAFGENGSNIRKELEALFSVSPVYLMVGTIEPKKNHHYVLDAFESLWSKGDNLCLCIVGRVGWLCEDIIERIISHPYFGNNLFYFSDLNDIELEYCYKNTKALIIASFVEGFGLPIVEAIHYGRPVIASDIPVFREIGEDYPIYFPLDNNNELVKILYDFEYGKTKKQFVPKTWLTWDIAIENLLTKVIAMSNRI